MKILLAAALSFSIAAPAFAQVPKGATGGPSGGPNQAQSVVPPGATGGRSGGPNQSQFVKKAPAKAKKKPHH